MQLTRASVSDASAGVKEFVRDQLHGDEQKAVLVAVSDAALASILLFAIPQAFAVAPISPDVPTHESHAILHRLRPALIITDSPGGSPLTAASAAAGIPIALASLDRNHGTSRVRLILTSGSAEARVGRSYPKGTALILQTSGTTGAPKIVGLSRSNLQSSAANTIASLRLTAEDRTLLVMPLTHIHGIVAVLYGTLASGGTLIALPPRDPQAFWQAYPDSGATWFSTVPSLLQAICESPPCDATAASARLRFIRTASSALPQTVRAAAEKVFGVPVLEAYGMTESCHQVASNTLEENRPGSVGQPRPAPHIEIFDTKGRRIAKGETGEICIRGRNVFTDYIAATDEPPKHRWRQIFSRRDKTTHWGRWFRTGDLGRIDDDGYLWINGRIKEQINRGGETISPVEIEEALLSLPGVSEAAVFPLPHPGLGEEIAAVCVADGVTESEIAGALADLLSFNKLPKKIFLEASLPKAASGKVSRSFLARSYRDRDPFGAGVSAPIVASTPARNTVERPAPSGGAGRHLHTAAVAKRLAAIFSDVLGVGRVSADTSFFALGGTSLKALQVVSAVRREFDVGIPISIIVTHPTIAALAAAIAERAAVPHLGPDAAPAEAPQSNADAFPLPASLVDFCLVDAIAGERDELHQRFVIRLPPSTSLLQLERALSDMVAAHPVLRTAVIRQTDGLSFSVNPESRVSIAVFDEVADRWSDSLALLAFFRQPIDLARTPLVRVAAQALREGGYAVAFQVPEIILDGYARAAFMLELAGRISGKFVAQPDRFIEISRRMPLQGTAPGVDEVFRVPADLGGPRGAPGAAAQPVEAMAWEKVQALAARWGVTPYALCLTVFASVLDRVAGGVVPVQVSLQCRRTAEEFFTLGNFTARAPFMLSADSGRRVSEVARETASVLLALLETPRHQPPPFNDDYIAFDYEDEAGTIGSFLGRGRAAAVADLDGLRPEFLEPRVHSLSIGLKITPPDNVGMNGRVSLSYDTGRFSAERARAILDAFLYALLSAETASDAPLANVPLTPTRQFLGQHRDPNSLSADFPTAERLDVLFAEISRNWAERPALTFPGGSVSFGELDGLGTELANALRKEAVTDGTAIAFWEGNHATKSEAAGTTRRYPIAALGILRAGAAVLPIGHQTPVRTACRMLKDAGVGVILAASATLPAEAAEFTHSGLIDTPAGSVHLFTHPAKARADTPPAVLRDAAYLMFTSGTTGAPKGIIQSHVSMVDLVRVVANTGIWPDGKTLPGPNIGFDVFTGVLWTTWLLGHAVHFRDEYELTSHAFAELQAAGVKSLITSPTAIGALIDQDEKIISGFDLVLLTGEALPRHTAKQLLEIEGTRRFANFYGPTEITVWATWDLLGKSVGPNVPIGKALDGYTVEVCDPGALMPMPANLPGEILIAPRRGMVGYFDDRLNGDRLVQRTNSAGETVPFYRSGDLGWIGDDAKLYYIGRQDRQVQAAGVRVELGGIEKIIEGLPAVHQVAVVDVAMPTGTYFAAFVVPRAGHGDIHELRSTIEKACQAELPRNAWPGTVRIVDELPRTSSGKVAFNELRARVSKGFDTHARTTPAAGTIAGDVAAIWKSLLARSEVFLEDDFKDLGGTSLGVLLLSGVLRDRFGVKITVSELFFNSVLGAQIKLVEQRLLERAGTEATAPSSPPTRMAGYVRQITGGVADSLVRIVEPTRAASALGDVPVLVGIPAGGGWTGAGVHLSRALTLDHVVKIVEYTDKGHRSYDGHDWLGIASAIVAELADVDPSRAVLVGASLGGWLAWLVERTWVAKTGKAGPRIINFDAGPLHKMNRWEMDRVQSAPEFAAILKSASAVASFEMLLLQRDFGPGVPFVKELKWDGEGGRVTRAPRVKTLLHGEVPIEPASAFAPYVEAWAGGDLGSNWPAHLQPHSDSTGQKLYRAFVDDIDRRSALYGELRSTILANPQYDQASEIFEMLALLAGDAAAYTELARRHYVASPADRFAVAKSIALSGKRAARSLNQKWLVNQPGDDLIAAIDQLHGTEVRDIRSAAEPIGRLRNDLPSWLYALSRGLGS